jgi:signal transduction histidine kinase
MALNGSTYSLIFQHYSVLNPARRSLPLMLRVIGCITEQHILWLVLLAAALCFFVCFTAVSMLGRARAAIGKTRLLWLGSAGVLTGSGIWATHFIDMLAYKTTLPMGFDAQLTFLSALIPIVLSTMGYWLLLGRNSRFWSGIIVGSAIGAMHYVGMAAVQIQADAIWSPYYVFASILFGIGFTIPALQLAMSDEAWQGLLASATLFAVGVVAVHFTGMAALVYVPDPSVALHNVVLAPPVLAITIAVVAFAMLAIGLIVSIVDRHLEFKANCEAKQLRRYIDELEATKRELLAAKFQADAANQAKSNFLANMSHDLRTPLNAIIGFTDLMQQRVLGPIAPARYGEYINDIHQSGKHLLSLINDILDLAKIESGHRELDEQHLSPGDLIQKAIGFIQPQAAASRVSLRTEMLTHDFLRGDERALVQLLTNLISNAVKFSSPGGGVRIFAESLLGGGMALGVEDQGPGMSPEDLKKALEPFGQAKAMETIEGYGIGLGLPIVRALVEAHGGILRIESEIDKGTRVLAEFPGERVLGQIRAA